MNYSVDTPLIESCCETILEALNAQENGADRIEYCYALDQQGLTPHFEELLELNRQVNIPIRPIIRPVDSFQATQDHISAMLDSIQMFQSMNFEGYVLGLLDGNKRVDWKNLEKLLVKNSDSKITFHKAIDSSTKILEDIKILNNYPSIDYILTSGGSKTALDGAEMILKMSEISNAKIMAGGSILMSNLEKVKKAIPLSAYHGRKIV